MDQPSLKKMPYLINFYVERWNVLDIFNSWPLILINSVSTWHLFSMIHLKDCIIGSGLFSVVSINITVPCAKQYWCSLKMFNVTHVHDHICGIAVKKTLNGQWSCSQRLLGENISLLWKFKWKRNIYSRNLRCEINIKLYSNSVLCLT